MATPRLGLVVEDKPTELSCIFVCRCSAHEYSIHACTTLNYYMTLCMVLEFKDLHVVVYSGTAK